MSVVVEVLLVSVVFLFVVVVVVVVPLVVVPCVPVLVVVWIPTVPLCVVPILGATMSTGLVAEIRQKKFPKLSRTLATVRLNRLRVLPLNGNIVGQHESTDGTLRHRLIFLIIRPLTVQPLLCVTRLRVV